MNRKPLARRLGRPNAETLLVRFGGLYTDSFFSIMEDLSEGRLKPQRDAVPRYLGKRGICVAQAAFEAGGLFWMDQGELLYALLIEPFATLKEKEEGAP